MASTPKGRPLTADRRYGAPADGRGKPPAKPPAPRRASKRSPPRQRGIIVRFVLFLWRIVWGIFWRASVFGATIVGCAVLYFYVQLPPVSALIDARARGSVTMLDANNQVFAWRGETFGGQVTPQTVSPNLLHAVIATEDKRFYQHFGISPRGIISAVAINLRAGRGAFEGNGGSTITQQTAKLLCLGVAFDPTQWKSENAYEDDCRSGGL
ncbi:MAG: hypothetical protein RIR04_211, partial [Pseudomonadota bacterium]